MPNSSARATTRSCWSRLPRTINPAFPPQPKPISDRLSAIFGIRRDRTATSTIFENSSDSRFLFQMREAFAQQRAVVEGRLESWVRADVVEPGRNARQILPIRHAEIMDAHKRRHDGDIGQRDLLA